MAYDKNGQLIKTSSKDIEMDALQGMTLDDAYKQKKLGVDVKKTLSGGETDSPPSVAAVNSGLANKASKTELATGLAGKQAVGDYATKSDLIAKANKTDVNSSLATKQDKLVSGTNLKTINNQSLLGSGNITIQGGGGSVDIDTSIPASPTDTKVPSTKLLVAELAKKANAGSGGLANPDAKYLTYTDGDTTTSGGTVADKLTELDSIGKYNSIGEFIPNNPLSSLTSSLSYASIFRTWGIVGASFETSYSQGYKVDTKESASFYDDVDDDVVKWTKIFAQVNGVKVADYCQAGGTLYGLYSSRLGQLLNNGEKEAYIFNMNGNDITTSKYNKEIGTFDDINLDDYEQNADTWYGLIGKYIQRTRATAPRAYIFFGTVRKSGTPNDRTIQMINAIKDIATHFSHVYILDMNTYGIDWSDSNVRNAYVSITHPNRLGHIYLFKAFNTYIDWYIKKNPIEMRDALFISHEEYKDTKN